MIKRVDRLRLGAITGVRRAGVDPAALGWTTEASVELFCASSTSPSIAAAVEHRVADTCDNPGEANALVRIQGPTDIEHSS